MEPDWMGLYLRYFLTGGRPTPEVTGWNAAGWGGNSWQHQQQQWSSYGGWPPGGGQQQQPHMLPGAMKNGGDSMTGNQYGYSGSGYDYAGNSAPRGENYAQGGGE